MPTRCVAGHCSNTHKDGVSLFSWPKDKRISKLWEKAVLTKRADFKATTTSKLCSVHFKDDEFSSQTRLSSSIGITYRPQLLQNAVPTIFQCPQEKKRKLQELQYTPSSSRSAYRKREAARVRTLSVHSLLFYVLYEMI